MLHLKIETAWAFVLQSWGYLQLAILISHCCRSSGYNFKSIGQAKVRDILKKCRVNSSYCQGKKGSFILRLWQSHYREVPLWEMFVEQELRFGLDLGRLAVLKKRVWANYEQLLRVFFSYFQGQKKVLNLLKTF